MYIGCALASRKNNSLELPCSPKGKITPPSLMAVTMAAASIAALATLVTGATVWAGPAANYTTYSLAATDPGAVCINGAPATVSAWINPVGHCRVM